MPSTPSDLQVLDHLADAVLTVDREGRITRFNRAAEALVGVSATQALGARCRRVLASDDHALETLLTQAALQDQPLLNRGVYLTLGDGRRIPVSVTASALTDEAGAVVGAVGTVRDLTGVFEGYLSGAAGDPRGDLRKSLLRLSSFAGIISRNHAMRDLFAILPEIAGSTATVLIMGPSGSGKELFARAVHELSPRKGGPLVVVNCGALPDTLLESELFGYVRGAFTDARRDKPGRFQQADGGTLFLDEVGDLSPAFQVKLLRALQEGEVQRLGALEPEQVDVRVLSATHPDLAELVRQGRFREDLYYRLRVLPLVLPPLRERPEDIQPLVDHHVARLVARTGRPIRGLSPDALALLVGHRFPGNVRELINLLERAFVLCRGGLIEPEHLPAELGVARPPQRAPGRLKPSEHRVLLADVQPTGRAWFSRDLAGPARRLTEALEAHGWNRTATAQALGISRTTLWRRMKEYGLS